MNQDFQIKNRTAVCPILFLQVVCCLPMQMQQNSYYYKVTGKVKLAIESTMFTHHRECMHQNNSFARKIKSAHEPEFDPLLVLFTC